MGKTSFPFPNIFRSILALTGSLLLFISLKATPPGPTIPPALQSRLDQYHLRDDLQDWVYDQLQWVAQQPGARASRLPLAVSEAWRAPRNSQEYEAWLDLLVNEGYSLLQAGDIVRSTDAYTAAWQWARRHADIADESILLNNILKPLGNNYTRLGDYEEADFIHHKALAISLSLKDKEALAGTYSNLANTASNRGSPQQALDYCRQGLIEAPAHSPYRGLLLSEQADALSALDQKAAAMVSIQKAVTVLKAATPNPATDNWLLVAYQQAGDIDSADPTAALRYYDQALAIENREAGPGGVLHRRETAKLLLRLGELYRRMHRPAQAISWLDQCLSLLVPGKTFSTLRAADLYAENTLADLLYTRAVLFSEDNSQLALSCFRLSFDTERRLRQQLITGSSREEAVRDSRIRHETAIRTAWEAWSAAQTPDYLHTMLEFMESSKAQLLLDELQQREHQRNSIIPAGGDSLRSRIRLLEKALVYYQEQSLQTGGDDSLAAVLLTQRRQTELDLATTLRASSAPPSDTLIDQPAGLDTLPDDNSEVRSFFIGIEAGYQIGVDHSGILFAERLDLGHSWEESTRQFLHAWFEAGPGNMIDHPRLYFDQAYAIWSGLFGRHPFQRDKHYIIVPDGPLDLLPIEALPTSNDYHSSPGDWPLVIRRNRVSYAWSIRTLGEANRSSGNPGGFTGFFLADNSRNLPSLQSLAQEEAGIARSIYRGEWLTDSQVSSSAFETALQRSAVVHISTHAFSARDSSSVPRIELYDRPFYIFQLSDLARHPALVVLSACRTGDGRMVAGEGAQSMARAFTSAGTNGVITGWWNVHDEVAARLMERFYRELRKSISPSEALSSAKRSWLEDPAVPYLEKLPWYWAALNYQGTTATLPADFYATATSRVTLSNPLSWVFVACLTLIILGIVWLIRKASPNYPS